MDRRTSDIAVQGYRARSATIALSFLLFISVYHGVLTIVKGEYLLAICFALGLSFQGLALISLNNKRALRYLLLAITGAWLALILSFEKHFLSGLEVHLLLTLCSYFLISLRWANGLNLLAWSLVFVIAYLDRQMLLFSPLFAALGVMGCANLVSRRIAHLEQDVAASMVTDKVTGCANKEALVHEIEKAWGIYRRYQVNASMIRLEITDLSGLRNELGHSSTNVLLNEIVAVWKSRLRNTDLLCRYDDAQFICLLPNTSNENAQLLAKDLCKACDEYEFSVLQGAEIRSLVVGCEHSHSWESWLGDALSNE